MWEVLVQVRELGSSPNSPGVREGTLARTWGREKVWRAIQIPAFQTLYLSPSTTDLRLLVKPSLVSHGIFQPHPKCGVYFSM